MPLSSTDSQLHEYVLKAIPQSETFTGRLRLSFQQLLDEYIN